jgi:hypothetical protein
MKLIKSIIPLYIIIFSSLTFSQFKFSGFGSVGYKVYDRETRIEYHHEAYYEAKLQGEYKVNKNIEAQIDLRGYSDDNIVVLQEVTIKFDYSDLFKVKVGNIRKNFGIEQMVSREHLILVERSYINDILSDYGFATRSVSILFYTNYKRDDKDFRNFPFSYYLTFSKNNSQTFSSNSRFTHHAGNFAFSLGYQYLYQGGDYPVKGHGATADIGYSSGDFNASVEGFYAANIVESVRRVKIDPSYNPYSVGANIFTSYRFDTGGDLIKSIEPMLLTGYFIPHTGISSRHTVQVLGGVGFYFQKDVRLRFNANLILSKTEFRPEYNSVDSRGIIDLQVRF